MAREIETHFNCERFSAEDRRFETVVVFVHHYAASKRMMKRHIRLINQLGFDAVAFDLPYCDLRPLIQSPMSSRIWQGGRTAWCDAIEHVCDRTPESVVFFSFSFPSCSALQSLLTLPKYRMKGWICDGGPFFDLQACFGNLFYYHYGVRHAVALALLKRFGFFVWGRGYEEEISDSLRQLPHNFPILNFRANNDRLVPPQAIAKVFAPHKHLDLKVVNLENTDHLMGIRDQQQLYKNSLEEFLHRCAQPL